MGDVVKRITTGLNPRDNFTLNTGGNNYYVTIKNFEHGILHLDEKCDLIDNEALIKIQNRSDLKKDDILFASIGRVGDCYLIKNTPQNWNINESIFSLRPNSGIIDPQYLFYAIHIDGSLNQIFNNITGSSFKSIKIGDLKNILIPIPIKKEQRKIATFCSNLDHFITLHQQYVELLKKYKRGLLSKLFPKNGEMVPELRFCRFEGDWERRKLLSLCDKFTDGDWIETKDQSTSGVRLIQTGNIGVAEYLDRPNSKKWVSNSTFNTLHCEEVFEGDILISRLPEPAGRACIVPNLGTKMITAVDCTIVRVSENTSSKFLLQHLSSRKYFDMVNAYLAGGTRQRISRGNLADLDIPIPSKKSEQETIGSFLTTLDHLISLHQQHINLLKTYKIGLLQSLFI